MLWLLVRVLRQYYRDSPEQEAAQGHLALIQSLRKQLPAARESNSTNRQTH